MIHFASRKKLTDKFLVVLFTFTAVIFQSSCNNANNDEDIFTYVLAALALNGPNQNCNYRTIFDHTEALQTEGTEETFNSGVKVCGQGDGKHIFLRAPENGQYKVDITVSSSESKGVYF